MEADTSKFKPKYISIDQACASVSTIHCTKNLEVLLFDVDQTLYYSPSLSQYEYNNKKEGFIKTFLEINGNNSKNVKKCEEIFNKNYKEGMSIYKVYMEHLNIGIKKYFSIYDDLDYPKFIAKDPILEALIKKLSFHYRIFALSNSSSLRCEKILKHLGIESYFEDIFCSTVLNSTKDFQMDDSEDHIMKPQKEAFDGISKYICQDDKTKIYFFDDNSTNVSIAKEMGFKCYLIDNSKVGPDHINTILENLASHVK